MITLTADQASDIERLAALLADGRPVPAGRYFDDLMVDFDALAALESVVGQLRPISKRNERPYRDGF